MDRGGVCCGCEVVVERRSAGVGVDLHKVARLAVLGFRARAIAGIDSVPAWYVYKIATMNLDSRPTVYNQTIALYLLAQIR